MSDLTSVLFVPVSGPVGVGEYFRCLAIADGVRRRWPDATIEFIVNRKAGYAGDVPYKAHFLDTSPTLDNRGVNRVLEAVRPDVAIFDSAGQRAQLARARQLGIRSVFISSRRTTRAKGFRLRRMRLLDQHWFVSPGARTDTLAWHERLRLRMVGRPEIVQVAAVVPLSEDGRAAELYRRIGVERGRYLLSCAGGGGRSITGVPDSEVFAAASERAGRATGFPAVAVMGPNYKGAETTAGDVRKLGAVGIEQMADLIAGARLVLTGGGSLLLQALTFRRPCVAVNLGHDQGARIGLFAGHGCVVESALDEDKLSDVLARLLADDDARSGMERKIERRGIRNGLPVLLDALDRLAAAPRMAPCAE